MKLRDIILFNPCTWKIFLGITKENGRSSPEEIHHGDLPRGLLRYVLDPRVRQEINEIVKRNPFKNDEEEFEIIAYCYKQYLEMTAQYKNKKYKHTGRLFLRVKDFQHFPKWAENMEIAIKIAVDKIDGFRTFAELRRYVERCYHNDAIRRSIYVSSDPRIKSKIRSYRNVAAGVSRTKVPALNFQSTIGSSQRLSQFSKYVRRIELAEQNGYFQEPVSVHSRGIALIKGKGFSVNREIGEETRLLTTILPRKKMLLEENVLRILYPLFFHGVLPKKELVVSAFRTGLYEDFVGNRKSCEQDEQSIVEPVIVHTRTTNFKVIDTELEGLYDRFTQIREQIHAGLIEKDEKGLNEVVSLVAAMYELQCHEQRCMRGNAGIANILMLINFDSCGISIPPWKENVRPDLEALIPFDDNGQLIKSPEYFIQNFPSLFDGKLKWVEK